MEVLWSPELNLALQRVLGDNVLPIVRVWSALADVWGLMVVLGVVLARRGLRAAYVVLLAVLAAACVNTPLVFAFRVDRPAADGLRILEELDIPSFPSGHVAAAGALWTTLARRRWLPWWTCAGAIALAATSRVYLGVHTVADVIAGAAVGIVAALAVTAAWPRAEPLWDRSWAVPVRRWAPLAFVGMGLFITQLGRSPKVWENAGGAIAAGLALAVLGARHPEEPPSPPSAARALVLVLAAVGPLWGIATFGPRWSAPVQAGCALLAGLWALLGPSWLLRRSPALTPPRSPA